MKFGHYLKECRKRYGLTQDQLIEALYKRDPRLFGGLDASGLSKWEREISHTSFQKMAAILRLFQELSGDPLPCLDENDTETSEKGLCEQALLRVLGTPPRHLVLDLGTDRLPSRHFSILPLRHFERMDELLEVHQSLHENLVPSYSRLELSQLREWALHPESLFYVVLYKRTFLGLLFAVRLQPERFEEIMAFRKMRRELTTEDFAREGERASILILSLFSLDSRVASLLLMRLYAHLAAHRRRIESVGLTSALQEVERMVERMDLRVHHSHKIEEETHVAYRNDLFSLLSNETAMRLLFPKDECLESSPSPDGRSSDRSAGPSADTLPE
jgi:transcriptional regulator with XRE-family HTH domain